MLDPKMASALDAHMGREFGAHFQYLALAAWFEAQGLRELAGFFFGQAGEEHLHAMKFLRYSLDAGGEPAVPPIPAAPSRFESAEDAVASALAWEETVTRHIHELVDLATELRDHATSAFLQWFVTEQVEEVATMTELLQVVRRAGEANLLLVEDYVARGAARGAAPAAGGAA